MLKWLMKKRIEAFEKTWNYDMSYARRLLAASPAALRSFAAATRLASFRQGLTREAWYAAKLRGTLSEDCGSCTELVVQMALREGLSPQMVSAIVRGATDSLPPAVAAVVRFCDATLAHSNDAGDSRDEVLRHHGELGLATIALTLAASRLYPTVKYALGAGHSCTLLEIGTEVVTPLQPSRRAA